MSLKRNETYPGRFSNPTPEQPQGAFKNRSAPGAQDGSFCEQQWANDWSGFFSRLLTVAGISPNGTIDTALASQYFDALIASVKTNLGTAAQRNVGTGATQLPAIESFTHLYDGGTRHIFNVPMSDGVFRTLTAQINLPPGITDLVFPVPFPTSVVGVMLTQYSQTSKPDGQTAASIIGSNTVRFVNWGTLGITAQYLAIGR